MPKDYSNISKEELIELVEKQEAELRSKKYGLVWDAEREPEQVVLDCEHHLPVLERAADKEVRAGSGQEHVLIEGDNYHALSVLNYTHKEKIDVIYIDPPYNTGNKDFVYNDRYVDKEDGYRHSKWLNFMEKRLNLAHRLLKKTGVIFISIDDNEMAQLKLLCDKIFGEENFVAQFVVIRAEGGRLAKQAVVGHEYVLVYAKSITDFSPLKRKKDIRGKIVEIDGEEYIIEEDWLRKEFGKYGTLLYEEIESVKGIEKKKEIDNGINLGKYVLLEKPQGVIVGRYKKLSEETSKFYTVLKHLNKNGKKDLAGIGMENSFDYPKPLSLIEDLVLGATFFDKDSTILDFMAGSGTTGHAVLALNKEDGGHRKFILCTNNENGICENVTFPRLEKVMKGYANAKGETVEGLGGSLRYFRTSLLKKARNKDQVRLNLTRECTEMLCVKEGIFHPEHENEDFRIFSSDTRDAFLCVYYNLTDDGFGGFIQRLKTLSGKKIVYVFSVDGKVDKKPFAGIDDCSVEEIPQKILEVYKQLVKMNIPVNSDTIFPDFEKAKKAIFDMKEKDEGARILRIVLEKTLQRISQQHGLAVFDRRSQGEKVSLLNDRLKSDGILSKIEWEQNRTYFAVGSHAAHGEYSEYDLRQVEDFYRHAQVLINRFNV